MRPGGTGGVPGTAWGELVRTRRWQQAVARCRQAARRARDRRQVLRRLPDLFDRWAELSAAGLPFGRVFHVLRLSAPRPVERAYLDALAEALEAGQPLAGVWSDRLPPLLRVLFAAGETSGQLEQVLIAWSQQTRRQRRWRNELGRSAAYPAALLVAVALLCAFVQVDLLPTLTHLFEGLGVAPPPGVAWVHRALVWGPGFVAAGMAGLAAGAMGVWRLRGRLPVRWRAWAYRMPGAEWIPLWRTQTACQLMGLLLRAGVPLAEALECLAASAGPRWLRTAAGAMRLRVLEGRPLAEALSGEWDPLFTEFVMLAEQTGDLAHALHQVADLTQRRLTARVESALRILSPVLLLGMAAMVAGVMWSVFVPMYDLMDQVSGHL
ncbi:type II secretion system F family protein [Alicyclobacillus macrosporangiidus]|uniref:type II secretion system F family protein n=1 Tax=Alicyclobacillus macrosporangiidus TaxID=392015 RepID=UPI000495535D|nr:type II secretion system F family protein [Alicyclobacillus macrosporangiidus]